MAGILFPVSIYLIFEVTPIPKSLELLFNQKIFYYHVASAFMLFLSVFVCGIYSVLFLVKRLPRYDDVAVAAGETAVLFGAIVLISGSIWGSAAWGKPWVWEARLTTSLLLWMIMVGYLIVRQYGGAAAERLGAGLAIFGMVDVPIIYVSVNIWNEQHPETTVVPTLGPKMRMTFWLCVLLWFCLFMSFLLFRSSQAKILRRFRDLRDRLVDEEFIE